MNIHIVCYCLYRATFVDCETVMVSLRCRVCLMNVYRMAIGSQRFAFNLCNFSSFFFFFSFALVAEYGVSVRNRVTITNFAFRSNGCPFHLKQIFFSLPRRSHRIEMRERPSANVQSSKRPNDDVPHFNHARTPRLRSIIFRRFCTLCHRRCSHCI